VFVFTDTPELRSAWLTRIYRAKIVLEGYLYKHRVAPGDPPKPGRWHRRYVVLQRRSLSVYRNAEVRCAPRRRAALTHARIRTSTSLSGSRWCFCAAAR
jgi:hypothetical protein